MSAYETASLLGPGDYTASLPTDGPFKVILSGMDDGDCIALERHEGDGAWKRVATFDYDLDGAEFQGRPGSWHRLICAANSNRRVIDAKLTVESA